MSDGTTTCAWCGALGVVWPDGTWEWFRDINQDPSCDHQPWNEIEEGK